MSFYTLFTVIGVNIWKKDAGFLVSVQPWVECSERENFYNGVKDMGSGASHTKILLYRQINLYNADFMSSENQTNSLREITADMNLKW